MAYSTILVEKLEQDKVGIITLNRPQVLNAIDYVLRQEMYQVMPAGQAFYPLKKAPNS
jgi:enoyl-CoA hydratase/carnithine racemase